MKKLLLATLLLIAGATYAQNVGIGTKKPDESAILDLRSSSKGFLLPRLTEKQRNAIPAPAEGLMVYQTGTNQGVYIYESGKWNNLSNLSGAATRFQNATIGTLTPNYLLVGDADGNVASSSLYFNNGRLGLGNIDTSIALNVYLPKSTTSTVAKFGTLNNAIAINVNSNGSTEIANVYGGIGNLYLKNGTKKAITITDEGKVGFGTNSPYTQFAIADSGRTLEFGYNKRLRGMIIEAIDRENNAGMDFIHYVENSASHRFYTQGTEKLRLTSDGNLGIGTNNPRSTLEVNGVISTQSGSFEAGGVKFHLASHHPASRTWTILDDYKVFGDFGILQSRTQTSSAKDSSIARLYINAAGDVGIGTTTPNGKFSVVGSLDTYLFIDKASAGENYIAAGNFTAFQTSGLERLRINVDGNVGIGTTSPTATLDVNGTLKAAKINGLAIGTAGVGNDSITNTRIGNGALTRLGVESYDNTAIGNKSMDSTLYSYGNIGVGSYTLYKNLNGSSNTGIGYAALYNNKGDENIGLGSFAGVNLTTGNRNIAIGINNNFPDPTASNQLLIAKSIYGTSIYSDTAKYGINTSNPTATLDINGTLRVRGGSPGVGKVLTSDANGNASWNTLNAGNPVNIMKYVLPSNHVGRGIVNWGATPTQTIGTAFGYMDAAGVFNVNVAGEYRVTISYSLSGDPDAFLIGPGNVRFLQFSGTQASGLPINGSVTDYLSLNAGGQIYWRFNNNVTLNAAGYNSKIIIEKIN